METRNVVVNDNEKTLLRRTNDEDESFFEQSGVITHPVQTNTVASPINNDDKNDSNGSNLSKKNPTTPLKRTAPSPHVQKKHPSSSIIGDLNIGITTRKKHKIYYAKLITNICYTYSIEPISINEALKDEF